MGIFYHSATAWKLGTTCHHILDTNKKWRMSQDSRDTEKERKKSTPSNATRKSTEWRSPQLNEFIMYAVCCYAHFQ